MADLNQGRSYFPAVATNGKIYVFGGLTSITTSTNEIEEYDLNSDTWVFKTAVLPQPMCAMAAVELDGAIYIIGGATAYGGTTSSKVYRYFPASDAFDADTIASLPFPRAYLSACAAGGKIYAIGGADNTGETLNNVDVYDPSTNQWTPAPDNLTLARAVHSSVVVGSKIYVMGGTQSWSAGMNSVEAYDTNAPNPTWAPSETLKHARVLHGSAVLQDIIYTLGGIESPASMELSVEAFGPEIADGDTWDVFDSLTSDRRAFGCVGVLTGGDTSFLYIMGGNSGTGVVNTTERLGILVNAAHEASFNPLHNPITLFPNSPNPFAQSTAISYLLRESADILISIFDCTGKLISTPVSGRQTPGEYRVIFEGAGLKAGIYFCVMNSSTGPPCIQKWVVSGR